MLSYDRVDPRRGWCLLNGFCLWNIQKSQELVELTANVHAEYGESVSILSKTDANVAEKLEKSMQILAIHALMQDQFFMQAALASLFLMLLQVEHWLQGQKGWISSSCIFDVGASQNITAGIQHEWIFSSTFSSSRSQVLRFHVSWAGHFVAGPWVFRLQGVAGQQVFGSALEILSRGLLQMFFERHSSVGIQ